MRDTALLLTGVAGSSLARVRGVLKRFGVPYDELPAREFWTSDPKHVRVLCGADTLLDLAATLDGDSTRRDRWREAVHSVFVFPGAPDRASLGKAAAIVGGPHASVTAGDSATEWTVSDAMPAFCGVMSGVRVSTLAGPGEDTLVFGPSAAKAVISSARGAAFIQGELRSVPVFLSASEVIDVDRPLTGRVFDIRAHAPSALPVVLYLKWALAQACWQPQETAACVVIDDPPLKARYGFLNFRHLATLMERANFSSSVAFIPWNWRRSARGTVGLFRDHPDRFSLSIHGCDHTGGEYASQDRGWLARKSRQAIERMEGHREKTGLGYDRVMVFPQGLFSQDAMTVLKRSPFIAVVNSEVISADPPSRAITVGDYWDCALMNYGEFPIFTRRYPWAGVENFAFDMLLGKPCLVTVHHNDCLDDCRHVVEFIEKLNRLNVTLRWTSLADVVRRSLRRRDVSNGMVEAEIYGTEALVRNSSEGTTTFRVRKRESAPSLIRDVTVDGRSMPWTVMGEHIEFETSIDPGEARLVAVSVEPLTEDAASPEGLAYKTKVMLRRYLCELRDNYKLRRSLSQ